MINLQGNVKPNGGESCPLFIFLNNYSKAKVSYFKKIDNFNRKNHVCYVYLLKNANNGLTQLTERKPDLLWVCVMQCMCCVCEKIPLPMTPKLFLRPFFQDTYSCFFCINVIKFLTHSICVFLCSQLCILIIF